MSTRRRIDKYMGTLYAHVGPLECEERERKLTIPPGILLVAQNRETLTKLNELRDF